MGVPEKFTVRPVFAVLNTKTLSLFENEHLSSLYQTLNLAQLSKIEQPPNWNVSGIFCDKVFRTNQKKPKQDDQIAEDVTFVLCFIDADSQESWKQAISNYYNCRVDISNDVKDVVGEGVEVRKVKVDGEAAAAKKIADLEAADKKAEADKDAEDQKESEALSAMSGTLKGLKDAMEKKRVESEKARLKALEERKRLMDLQDFLHKEEDCLNEEEQKKQEESEQKAESAIVSVTDENANDMMLGAEKKVLTEADKSRLIAESARIDQLNAEKQMNKRLKDLMVQVSVGYEQVLDTADCTSSDLGTAQTNHIGKICTKMFGINRPPKIKEMKDCMVPKTFCRTCCEFYIGAAHLNSRNSCKGECENKMKGKGPVVMAPVSRKLEKINLAEVDNALVKKFTGVQTAGLSEFDLDQTKKEVDSDKERAENFKNIKP